MTKRPFSSGLSEERFEKSDRPIEVRPLFEMGSELPPTPEIKQEIDDRKERQNASSNASMLSSKSTVKQLFPLRLNSDSRIFP